MSKKPKAADLLQALERADGVYKYAAEALGVNITTFNRYVDELRDFGFHVPKPTGRERAVMNCYTPSPDEIAATCRAIREAKGEILPPTQAEWDQCIGDGA